MIKLELLGGVKKAVGKSSVILEETRLPICEILMLLRRNVKEPGVLTLNNILIAVNGVEYSSLDGTDTVVESGDTVTIVTVAHGG
ncbi:MAG TPA: MoaD/ThiS family protein [Candidatus Eisenbacteria bacterium]|jgi:molybdopterin converting factor small subunit|nr:MoaD/ThiS family protein [Candidatus Eisenbacteria bacterium]